MGSQPMRPGRAEYQRRAHRVAKAQLKRTAECGEAWPAQVDLGDENRLAGRMSTPRLAERLTAVARGNRAAAGGAERPLTSAPAAGDQFLDLADTAPPGDSARLSL